MAQYLIPAQLLAAVVKAAVSHAKADISVIGAVLIETDDDKQEIRFVSTDGYRLYHRTIGAKEQNSGQFPNYRQIVPDTFRHVVNVDRKALQAACKAMPGFHSQEKQDKRPGAYGSITISLNGSAEIKGSDKLGNPLSQTLPTVGDPYHYSGEGEVTVTLSAKYLADSLASLDAAQPAIEAKNAPKAKIPDLVTIEANGSCNAVMFSANTDAVPHADRQAARSLLMPIRA